jgi:hypothetical protein
MTDEPGAARNNTFTFVAPAYVHGIIQGEILDENSKLYIESFWSKLWRWLFGGNGPDMELKIRMQTLKNERQMMYLA